jgi:aromatic ring-opening dioxygenase catalytic subunit (LigB family)
MPRGAVISISHGGGPLPLLGDPSHTDIVRSLKTRVPKILRLGTPDAPRAIVLVTAHWSEKTPTISNSSKHKLFYDYYGFPSEAYKIKYDAPGEPDVAKEIFSAFSAQGLKPKMDPERGKRNCILFITTIDTYGSLGWDHGVFVPLKVINPAADIPIVQVSVLSSEDPSAHFSMGKALAKLRDSNIAIIGSGFASLHNLGLMFRGGLGAPAFKQRNEEWSKAVTGATLEKDLGKRQHKFDGWREWPGGYEMHPPGGGEHFMPLIVCAGAGGEGEAEHYTDKFVGLDMYSYYWA